MSAALIRSKWPELDVNGIHAQLKKTAVDLAAPGWDPETGWGLLDLSRALAGENPLDNDLFGTLEITVVDKEGAVVPYARVLLRGEDRDFTSMTYTDGKVLFMAQSAGTYTVKVGKNDLRGEATVTVKPGETCSIQVTITAAGD